MHNSINQTPNISFTCKLFAVSKNNFKNTNYFVFFAERIPCGEPEVPVEGEVERAGENKAVYSCREGHTLQGDDTLSCSSKGKWQGQTPRCKGE